MEKFFVIILSFLCFSSSAQEYMWIIKPQFQWAGDFSDSLAPVQMGEKFGYINKRGKFVVDAQYEDAHSFVKGKAAVKLNGKYGYIDVAGKVISPFEILTIDTIPAQTETDSIKFEFFENLAGAFINGAYGFVNRSGEVVIQPRYSDVGNFSEGLAWVCGWGLLRKYGFIDISGKIVISPQFSETGNFKENMCAVKYKGKWGYIKNPTLKK